MTRLIIALVLFLVAIGVAVYVVQPAYGKWRDLQQEKQMLTETLREQSERRTRLRQLAERLQSEEVPVHTLHDAIPEKPDVDRIIHFVANEARSSGATLHAVNDITIAKKEEDAQQQADRASPRRAVRRTASGQTEDSGNSNESNKKQLRTISFSVRASGTYTAMKSFLRGLEQSNRLFEVGGITLQPVTGGRNSTIGKTPALEASFTVTTHSF